MVILFGMLMTEGLDIIRFWRVPVLISDAGAPSFARLVMTLR